MSSVRFCKRCVMNDASDPYITFDENGICNYCTDALIQKGNNYFPNAAGKAKLEEMIERVKASGKGKKYDCVMGISGGLDSSYLAYLGHRWGLRILAVHIDDGYDTEISKSNIKKLCDACNIELRIIKPDAKQFNALTLAYIKAGVPNLAVPQDNILLAFLYDTLKKEQINYFLSGGNFALECILQKGDLASNLDTVNIKAIHQQFGTEPVDKLKFISISEILKYRLKDVFVEERPLNYIEYNRDRAFKELNEFCGFEYYGRKHLENILTAFVQLYWLPKKFGIDKRYSHLSSMIVSDQKTREEAFKELEEPLYNQEQMDEYIGIIAGNMGVTRTEIEELVAAEPHGHKEFKTYNDLLSTKCHVLILKAALKIRGR